MKFYTNYVVTSRRKLDHGKNRFRQGACCKPKIGHLHENRFLYPNKVENLKCINIMLVPGDINYATSQPIKDGFFLNLAEEVTEILEVYSRGHTP